MVHPIDASVGAQVRALRRQRGMTQTELGTVLGLTFQQVQKYERGTNRISASKLALLAEALKVPVGLFFEGVDGGDVACEGAEDMQRLVAAFEQMPSSVQGDFLRMIQSIGSADY
ncbi:MAG: helix-turn-helix transcriptional regulator [Alphaproteobacteria bacterium]|nr:helix-turn-helix transcriptional regulator [Alphaproteobacteria bacterium]